MKFHAIIGLLLYTSVALADPTRHHIKNLHDNLDQLTRQFDAFDPTSAETADLRAAEHLTEMEAHLRLVRQEVCGSCENERPDPSKFQQTADRCADAGNIRSSLTPTEYQELMRKELHRMNDRLFRISNERSYFYRKTLLRQYYDGVKGAIDNAKPVCGSTGGA